MAKPDLATVPPFYHTYINKIEGEDLLKVLEENTLESVAFFEQLPAEKWDHSYAENKWSIKSVLQHLIDAERIFCYRALRFARKDQTPLPGFDEDFFATTAQADRRTGEDLLEEFKAVRKGTIFLFKSFAPDQLNNTGISNQNSISVNAIGFIVAGHTKHHLDVIAKRYL